MNDAVGFIEFSSIAKGIEAADAILKTAETTLVFAKETCPGKYNILFCGEVSSVNSSLSAARELCGHYVIDSLVIPRLDSQVIPAINQTTPPGEVSALGILEFYTVTQAVYAADAAVKAADIRLLNVRLATGIGGKSFVVFSGSVAAVKSAAAAGSEEAERNGTVVAVTVIPNPRPEVFATLL
ncbi:MAG: BMC domain-containing protein [Treponema sp.]|jgi:microcompartment protein CcmL/EutN|nr:BMC domain-containing protein [Treponema sp.]